MARANPSAYAIPAATTTDVVRTKNNELIAALNDMDQNGVIGSRLTVQDEGSSLAVVDTPVLNFVGAGVAATGAGQTKTITIPGGSVSSSGDDNQDGVLRVVDVSTVSALNAAVAAAIPGDKIRIASGIYTTTINGITPVTSGTRAHPIRVCGIGPVIIEKTTAGGNLAMNLIDIDWWIFEDFELRVWNLGVVLIRSDDNILRNIRAHDTTGETFHVRSGRRNLLEDCWGYNAGAEGFYIGSDQGAWATYTDDGVGTPAVADYTIVRRAKAWNCVQEALEIKENTQGCIVEDSEFDHTGQRVDSLTFVVGNTIKGYNNIIRRNRTTVMNKYAWNSYNGIAGTIPATGNLFEGNDMDAASPVTAVTNGINIQAASSARVKTSNTISAGTLTNVATEA